MPNFLGSTVRRSHDSDWSAVHQWEDAVVVSFDCGQRIRPMGGFLGRNVSFSKLSWEKRVGRSRRGAPPFPSTPPTPPFHHLFPFAPLFLLLLFLSTLRWAFPTAAFHGPASGTRRRLLVERDRRPPTDDTRWSSDEFPVAFSVQRVVRRRAQ